MREIEYRLGGPNNRLSSPRSGHLRCEPWSDGNPPDCNRKSWCPAALVSNKNRRAIGHGPARGDLPLLIPERVSRAMHQEERAGQEDSPRLAKPCDGRSVTTSR